MSYPPSNHHEIHLWSQETPSTQPWSSRLQFLDSGWGHLVETPGLRVKSHLSPGTAVKALPGHQKFPSALDSKVRPPTWETAVPQGAFSSPHSALTSASLPLHIFLQSTYHHLLHYSFYLFISSLFPSSLLEYKLCEIEDLCLPFYPHI